MRSPYARARRVVNRQLVRERDRHRGWELLAVGVAVCLVGLGMAAFTWIHLETLRVGYEIDRLERSLRDAERREHELELELSERRQPAALVAAGEALGLAAPKAQQVTFVRVPAAEGAPSEASGPDGSAAR